VNRNERNALVVENLPLVGYLVSDLCSRATHLSRDDLASARLRREHGAGFDGLTVEMHRARAALARIATDVRAREA